MQKSERLDVEVFVVNDALGVMGLDGHGAGAEFTTGHVFQSRGRIPTFRLGPVGGNFTIDADGDVFAFDFDAVVEPFTIAYGSGVEDVFHGVKSAGFLGVLVLGTVHLAFVTLFRPAFFLVLSGDVEAGVGAGHVLHFAFELKVGEFGITIGAHVKEVGAAIADFDGAVFDGEAAGSFLIGFPAREVLAIEHGDPAICLRGSGGGSWYCGGLVIGSLADGQS